MQIAQSKTREQFPLSPRKIIKKTISGTIMWLILLVPIALLAFFMFFAYVATSTIISGITNKSQVCNSFDCVRLISEKAGTLINAIFTWSLVVLLIIIILQYFYQRWYFATYFYDLTPDFIQIKKGPIILAEIIIPYERLQDVYVDQDLLDRMFGLYDVHISSATATSGLAAHIDGVEKPAADGLRAILLQTIKERISKNRV